MIPSRIVWLAEIPLTSNGKLDADRLPDANAASEGEMQPYSPPSTPTEATLAEIWAGVLKRERVGTTDNFFFLGGDSIATIQVVARASQAGIQVAPKQLFTHPTIRELAAVASVVQEPENPGERPAGPVPLSPIQRWFFEPEMPDSHHYNQAIWLDAAGPLNHDTLDAALQAVASHHDAFRLRFTPMLDGWRQLRAVDAGRIPLDRVDLADVDDAELDARLDAAAGEVEASLDLVRGPLCRATVFTFGGRCPDRVLLVVHHLVVDGVSWSFLLEDLQRAYLQITASVPVALAARTASFATWAEYLTSRASDLAGGRARDEWLSPARLAVPPLPSDGGRGRDLPRHASSETVAYRFSAEATAALLDTVCVAYNLQVQEGLLAMVLEAVFAWSGNTSLLVDVESHGRHGLPGAPDVSRTVGWFTARYPLVLERRRGAEPDAVLKSVKEQVRRLSERGVAYGLLRYLSDDVALTSGLAAMPQPDVTFNYLGNVGRVFPPGSPFTGFREALAGTRAPSTLRRFRFEFAAVIDDGRLELAVTFSRDRDRRATADALLGGCRDALASFIGCAAAPGTPTLTPSDFPGANLSQHDLDHLLAEWTRDFS